MWVLLVDDHLSQGDHLTQEQRTEEDRIEKSSGKETMEGSVKEEHDRPQSSTFGCLESREDAAEHMGVRDTALEVRDVFHVSSLLAPLPRHQMPVGGVGCFGT